MNRLWIFMLILACPVVALSQTNPVYPVPRSSTPPYQPAVAAPTTNVEGGGGYGWGGSANTAQGAALNGMSQVISAKGQYNLNTSAAAINMTEAQSNEMRNQVQSVQTFWAVRDIGRMERDKERRPPPTAEDLARMAHYGVPNQLTTSEADPVSGRLQWPGALQQDVFTPDRQAVDELFAKRVVEGGLPYPDQVKFGETVDSMYGALRSQIRQIPPPDYMTSKNFLSSLKYAITRSTL